MLGLLEYGDRVYLLWSLLVVAAAAVLLRATSSARARAQATDAVVQHLNTELEGANRQLQQLDGALKRIDALETVRYLGMGSFGVVYLCRTPGGKQVVSSEASA